MLSADQLSAPLAEALRAINSEKIITRQRIQRRLQSDDHERLIVLRIEVAQKRAQMAEHRVTELASRGIPVVANGLQQTAFAEVFAAGVLRLSDSVRKHDEQVARTDSNFSLEIERTW